MTGTPRPVPASVVIPAHNEEHTVGRLLRSLTAGAADGELEIVVVCNGCTDATAEVARRAAPTARVVELSAQSKIAALNEGDRVSTRFPRLYIDADIEMDIEAARATIALLAGGGAECAAPRADYVLDGLPWAVRRYHEIWQQLPYFSDERVGHVYGVSESGRARFGLFPPIIADDQFVLQHFDRTERKCLQDFAFQVYPPRNLAALVRTRTRVYRGNYELGAQRLTPVAPTGGAIRGLLRLAARPGNWPAIVVYSGATGLAKLRARRQAKGWERDDSARLAAATTADTTTTAGGDR